MCMQSIVWFSGPSAMNLIDVIPYDRYVEIGCNHFDQYRSVQHLVAYDRQVIQNYGEQNDQCEYWTQPKWSQQPLWKSIKKKNSQHIGDSGQLAVALSLQLGASHTYIIGCDWQITDASIQDIGQDITWVHLERRPWMQNYLHHSDFLDLATSSRH